MSPTRLISDPAISRDADVDDTGAVRSIIPYLLAWVATTIVIVAVVWVINDRYADREMEREAQALERTVEYVAVVIGGEVARLDENAKAIAEHRQGGKRAAMYFAGDESIAMAMQERVESEVRSRGYEYVHIVDRQATSHFSAGPGLQDSRVDVDLVKEALKARTYRRSDMALGDAGPGIVNWAAPLVPGEGAMPAAAMFLGYDFRPSVADALGVPGPWDSLTLTLRDAEPEGPMPAGMIVRAVPVAGTPWVVQGAIERSEVLEAATALLIAGALAALAVSIASGLGLVLLRRISVQRDREHRANELLAQQLEAEERFAATMSHELRTPLNSIIGFARVLESGTAGPVTDEQRKQLSIIASAGKRLLALVNDLLDLSKARSGMTIPQARQFTADEVIDSVAEITCPLSREKGLTCSRSLPPHEIKLHTDRGLLERILVNLAGNAIKFTPPGGSVSIEVLHTRGHDTVEFVVADTGFGIAPDDMDRITEEFYQGSSVPAEHREAGTGLGLPISMRLANLLGGEIVFESELGAGSTFRVRIPSTLPADAMSDRTPRGL